MPTNRISTSFTLCLTVLAVAGGCTQDAPRGDPLAGGPPVAGPKQPEMPHGHPQPALPAGHPPMDAPPRPAPPLGQQASAAPFTWTAPPGWKETKPSSSMRVAQFEADVKWDDGVPVVCALFGAIGGGRQANVDRWIAQFQQKDGTDSKSKAKVTETQRDGLTVVRVELTGAFSDGMVNPPRQTDDGMLLGGIVESADGASIYVKMTGPREGMAAQSAAFDAFLASFKKR